MSLFREICTEPAKGMRDSIWQALSARCQIVVPLMMVEEVLVNIVRPGNIPSRVIEMMASDVLQLQPCWIDDVFEYAFHELVQRQPFEKPVPPPAELLQRLLVAKSNDPELVKRVEERKPARKATATNWITEQKKLAPADGFYLVKSEQEFFERAMKMPFFCHLDVHQKKQEMLETILGETFRFKYPDAIQEIDTAFAHYGKDNYKSFPFTFNCLSVWWAYILAPIFRIQTTSDSEPRMILNPDKFCQANNLADEQYVVSALICDRLLTMDNGMRNIARVFQTNQRWRGQTIFFLPAKKKDLLSQINTLLV